MNGANGANIHTPYLPYLTLSLSAFFNFFPSQVHFRTITSKLVRSSGAGTRLPSAAMIAPAKGSNPIGTEAAAPIITSSKIEGITTEVVAAHPFMKVPRAIAVIKMRRLMNNPRKIFSNDDLFVIVKLFRLFIRHLTPIYIQNTVA